MPEPAPRRVVLVRHAETRPDPAREAHLWELTDAGRTATAALADRLATCGIERVITSEEGKARATGALLARALDVPAGCAPGLHEHDRRGVGFLPRATFDAALRRFFAEPERRVFGGESAVEALTRFETALARVFAAHPAERLALVSHGTVLSLYLAHHVGEEPHALWQRMTMPDAYAFEWPGPAENGLRPRRI